MPSHTIYPLGVRYDGRPVVPPVSYLELASMARRDEETPQPGATSAARRLVNNILDWLKNNALGDWSYTDRQWLVDPAAPGVGWGVVYHRSVPQEIRAEVDRLVEHRQGYPLEDWSKGDTLLSWLEKHGVDPLNRDVTSKLPYYILIVARPDLVPFHDQFELSRLRAVGRLDLGGDPLDYRSYVESLIAGEGEASAAPRILLSASRPTGDEASRLCGEVLLPDLARAFRSDARVSSLASRLDILDDATSADLKIALRPDIRGSGEDGARKPSVAIGGSGTIPRHRASEPYPRRGSLALAFLAAPGISFPINHPRQREEQGGWIGSDWMGGPVPREAYLGGEQVGPDFCAPGSVLFSLASYGAGTPQKSEYAKIYNAFHSNRKAEEDLAQQPFQAALPRRLLSVRLEDQPACALAFVGSTDITWTASFWDPGQATADGSLYETFVRRLLLGETVGMAAAIFPGRVQACNEALAGYKDKLGRLKIDVPQIVGRLWIERNHARGFVILGDPAVRIRKE